MIPQWLRQKPTLASKSSDKVKTALVQTVGLAVPAAKSPDEALGELFDAVQRQQVYPDGKTFADLIPRKRAKQLAREYEAARRQPNFNLQTFIDQHFYEFHSPAHAPYAPAADTTLREHISRLWPQLTRRNRRPHGSLIALPYAYVVPGGRFSEQYYWDSYFIMLGLAADHQWSLIHGIIKNCSYMLLKFGMIPTANRTYYLSRSQPPFFAAMVQLLASHRGHRQTLAEFLPSLIAEYRFWMKDRRSLTSDAQVSACVRVVQMPNGTILNRYYDDKVTPRPESRREDLETAAASEDKDALFIDLRAGAESGWDFSSRWFRDDVDLQSIHTTDIVPVDLNCLLYQLEQTIAESYELLKQPLLARRFRQAAKERAEAIRQFCWDESRQIFDDFDVRTGQVSGKLTLAMVFPLYTGIATKEQAAHVAARIERQFLQIGGVVTTVTNTGQQWDAPNGWAPLQWVAIEGLRAYGYNKLARVIAERWMTANERIFAEQRKMVEKYDVMSLAEGGGGEYPLQDGFGWTNGVYAALYDRYKKVTV